MLRFCERKCGDTMSAGQGDTNLSDGTSTADSTVTELLLWTDALHMHETAIFPLPLLNLTSPSCSLTPISFKTKKISAIRVHFRQIL